MPDVADFLGFLTDHEGDEVNVEVGVRADDLPDTDRPIARLSGRLERLRMVDDGDREGRGVAWVPIESPASGRVGFYVESDRTTTVVINSQGAKARFFPGHYITVVPS